MLSAESVESGCSNEDSRPEVPHVCEDEEFWFTDGNVILVSGETSFRVHQGVVSRHSEVFRDLFSVPQPENEEKRFGCPVICLSDSPIDLRYLLRVLYDGRKYYLKRREEQLELAEVAALVGLAQKYQIEDLREDGILRLKTCFTDKFDVWEDILNKSQASYSSTLMRFRPTDAIAAVDLAHRTDTLSMLPIALYLCCTLESSYLIRGVTRADGTVERLSPEDLERCLDARTYLLNRNISMNQQIYGATSPSCSDRSRCSIILERASAHRVMNSVGAKAHHVLRSTDEFAESLVRSFSLCRECLALIKSRDLIARRTVWNELPTFFGLTIPDWNRDIDQ
ncbi:hypothetical protein SCP_1501800 [Sparassis crispa]|uniref:BTB domain-containing protein n=1 Tax=Sparassis crispa TaxID=139825 RepID=A0A401H430_9APHY|nr:hypothetical protein SCP_1501800 [Sparassis crispa]GBE89172.1 hypothetical protein SCP_1501800 [Sparassis crispa]